jgi:hypothetical protein
MKTPKFELNKLKRLVRTNGEIYNFEREILDKFKEPTGAVSVTVIHGVFHQTTEHILVTGTDAASVQDKTSPFILALYDEAKDIKQGDKVTINDKVYNVSGVTNPGEFNLALDISLEVVV